MSEKKTHVFDDPYLMSIDPKKYYCTTSETIGLMNGKKYSIGDLEFIVENLSVSLYSILSTQKLTHEFCIKYILRGDERYCITDGDSYIGSEDILHHQKHLSNKLLYP